MLRLTQADGRCASPGLVVLAPPVLLACQREALITPVQHLAAIQVEGAISYGLRHPTGGSGNVKITYKKGSETKTH